MFPASKTLYSVILNSARSSSITWVYPLGVSMVTNTRSCPMTFSRPTISFVWLANSTNRSSSFGVT